MKYPHRFGVELIERGKGSGESGAGSESCCGGEGVRRRSGSQKSSQKSSQKKVVSAQQKIVALMQTNSAISTQQIADELKVTRRTVAKLVLELKMAGAIRRVGPDRGGHWEIIESVNTIASEKEDSR